MLEPHIFYTSRFLASSLKDTFQKCVSLKLEAIFTSRPPVNSEAKS